MDELLTLLATDHRRTLEFFFVHLQDVTETSVDRRELLYNASVLAHYAQVSTYSDIDFPTPPALATLFDHFVGTAEAPIVLDVCRGFRVAIDAFRHDHVSRRHRAVPQFCG